MTAHEIAKVILEGIKSLKPKKDRKLIAIAGPPGAGKSTVAEIVTKADNDTAAKVLETLDEASDIEEDLLDKAWGLEQTSRLSCQAVPTIDEEIEIELPKYNINMVSEDH